jgi:PPP family 3-phenylpropionic acid transporter
MKRVRLPSLHPAAVRFVPFYVGINFIGGVHLPFFPAWLESRGLAPEAIGLLMMVMGLVRVVSGPLLGMAADAMSARRQAVILLMLAATVSYAGYAVLPGIAFIVLFSVTASIAFSAVGPLLEGVTLKTALAERFDYGRVRSFGSAAFIAMNFGSGVYLAAHGIDQFLPLLIGSSVLALLASLALPHEERPVEPVQRHLVWRDARALARQPAFLWFLLAAGLAQACHAFYYGFGTLNWKALGYSADLIGLLWALGVAAEILLFSFSGRVVAWLGPVRLLVLGTACGLLRWSVLALSPPLEVLLPLQLLHAGTFGAAHLGAMHFVARAVPPHLVGTAQSILGAVTIGVLMAGAQFASGHLFASFGAQGYLLMTVLSGVALVASVRLGRAWAGNRLLDNGR